MPHTHKTNVVILCFTLITLLTLGMAFTTHSQQLPDLTPINDPVVEIHLETEINQIDMNTKQVTAVASHNGLWIFNADLLQLARLYEGEIIKSVSWHSSSEQLAVVRNHSHTVELWLWDDATNTLTFDRELPPIAWYVASAVWSPDGERIAAATMETADPEYAENTQVVVWTLADGSLITVNDLYLASYEFIKSSWLRWHPHPDYPNAIIFNGLRWDRPEEREDPNYVGLGDFVVDALTGERIIDAALYPTERGAAWHPTIPNLLAFGDDIGIVFFTEPVQSSVHHFSNGVITDGYFLASPGWDLEWSPDGAKVAFGEFVVDYPSLQAVGLFDVPDYESYVVDVEWFSPDPWFNNQGDLLMAENLGRMTIQRIDRLQRFGLLTPTFTPTLEPWITPTETPEGTPPPTEVIPIVFPVANAGEDRSVYVTNEGDLRLEVTLDGSGSYSQNGDIVNYTWTGYAGTDDEREWGNSENPVAVVRIGIGTHTIRLTVTDELGYKSSDLVDIRVIPVTMTPSPTRLATVMPHGTSRPSRVRRAR